MKNKTWRAIDLNLLIIFVVFRTLQQCSTETEIFFYVMRPFFVRFPNNKYIFVFI